MEDVGTEKPSTPSATNSGPGQDGDRQGIGCLAIVIVGLISGAVSTSFQSAKSAPSVAIAACAMSAMGFGVVYVCARYGK